MTYDARETSVRSGAPLELLRIAAGSATYYLTAADESVTWLAQTYTPTPLTIRPPDSDGAERGTLTFEIPASHALAELLKPGVLQEAAAVTLFVGHRDEAEFLTTFLGDTNHAAIDAERLIVTCRSIEGQLDQKLPRMLVQRTCPNQLYDGLCQVNPDDFDFSGDVSAIDGRTVTVTGAGAFAGADASYFANGVLKKDGFVIGYIERQDGDDLLLLTAPPPSLVVTDTVVLLAGCDRTIGTCLNRFNNVRNYNGHHAIPLRNPFSGRGLRP